MTRVATTTGDIDGNSVLRIDLRFWKISGKQMARPSIRGEVCLRRCAGLVDKLGM
jgi:hypothetical protein